VRLDTDAREFIQVDEVVVEALRWGMQKRQAQSTVLPYELEVVVGLEVGVVVPADVIEIDENDEIALHSELLLIEGQDEVFFLILLAMFDEAEVEADDDGVVVNPVLVQVEVDEVPAVNELTQLDITIDEIEAYDIIECEVVVEVDFVLIQAHTENDAVVDEMDDEV